MRYFTAFLVSLALVVSVVGQTLIPGQKFLAHEKANVSVGIFAGMNSKVKQKKLLIGRVDIENLTDSPMLVEGVTLQCGDYANAALSQDETREAWKGPGVIGSIITPGLDGLAKGSMTAHNIAGQLVPPHKPAIFTAAFLVPKKLKGFCTLTVGEFGSVKLTKQ